MLGSARLCRRLTTCTEYNDVQCDKRNSYRRKVKEEKAATSSSSMPADGEQADESFVSVPVAESAAATNGRAREGETEPPSKKIRREAGDEDDDVDDDEADAGDDAEDGDEDEGEGEEDGEDEEMEEVEDAEEPVEDGLDADDVLDRETLGADVRDEALDEPDSD